MRIQRYGYRSIIEWNILIRMPKSGFGDTNITGLAEPEQVRTVSVSDGILETLGVPPAAGRWLLPSDQIPGPPGSAAGQSAGRFA